MKIAKLLAPICSIAFCRLVASQSSEQLPEEHSADHLEEYDSSYHNYQDSYGNVERDDGLEQAVEDDDDHRMPAPLHEQIAQRSLGPEDETDELFSEPEPEDVSSINNIEHEDIPIQTRATLLKQQVKRVGLGVEQVKQILLELKEEEEEAGRAEHGFTGFETIDDDDDRTLLDIFGQVAKEFLTKKMVSLPLFVSRDYPSF
jgi:hypothetical protein